MDESLQIKCFKIDEKNQKAKMDSYKDYTKTVKDSWNLQEFEKIEMTENTVYQGVYANFIHSSNEIAKDYEMISWEEMFYCDDLIDGPVKLEQVNKIMYVTKSLYKSDWLEEEEENQNADKSHSLPLRHESISMTFTSEV